MLLLQKIIYDSHYVYSECFLILGYFQNGDKDRTYTIITREFCLNILNNFICNNQFLQIVFFLTYLLTQVLTFK